MRNVGKKLVESIQLTMHEDGLCFKLQKEPFGPNRVQSLSFAVHRDLNLAALQKVQVGLAGKMAALIRIDDFRLAMAKNADRATQILSLNDN